jgi:hypothetical protein
MKKLLVAAAVGMLSFLVFAPLAQAVSPSQQECEDASGTFTRIQGTVTCVIEQEPEKVGNAPPHSNAQETQITEEESSKGTLQNEPQHEEETSCTGPPGQCKQRT